MSHSRVGAKKAVSTAAAVVIVIIVAVVAVIGYAFIQSNQPPANFALSLPSSITVHGNSNNGVPVTIHDSGGPANSVMLTFSSSIMAVRNVALGNIGVGQSIPTVNPEIADVDPGQYTVQVTYSYQDASGANHNNLPYGNVTFNVLPEITITNPQLSSGMNPVQGNLPVTFQIKSGSYSLTYKGLSASIVMLTPAEGMTLNTGLMLLGDIGPNGTSNPYTITVQTNNTPQGSYKLELVIYYNNQNATDYPFTINVSN